jgi:diadenosine tetraphosphate (Ap4A) HIT family hydrolase
MDQADCPFCTRDPQRTLLENRLATAFWDGYPVSTGHALVAPRRHVSDWFDTSLDERLAILELIDAVKHEIEKRHRPDGYNIGINVGEAAGQTVFHLHVHVIPRYAGDVDDPRGGVRHVLPEKARYWEM